MIRIVALLLFPIVAFAQTTPMPVTVIPAVSAGVDISGVLNDLLQVAGLVILAIGGTLATIVANKLRTKYGIQVTDAQAAQMQDTANKALTWAITKSSAEIKANGWDHLPTQQGIIADAAQYAVAQFPDVMASAGLDISTPAAQNATAQKLAATVMQRVLPAAMATAADSPATPPVVPAAPK